MNWRRELYLREAREIDALRRTPEWSQAMVDLCFQDADLNANAHNVRMVAARAQQLKEEEQSNVNS